MFLVIQKAVVICRFIRNKKYEVTIRAKMNDKFREFTVKVNIATHYYL